MYANRKPPSSTRLAARRVFAAVALALAAAGARADEAPPADEGNKATTLEGVTVTATKRDVDIDSVPIAVTSIEGQDLANDGIRDTQSLPMVAPSLVVQISGNESSGTAIRIRGIGTAASNPGLEGSVGVFVDGVYRSRAGLALSDLVDIDHVEVLRGPQSTLFGKNTSAGVVSITTNKPTFTPEANAAVSLGNYGGTILSGAVSGPVVDDTVAVRLAAQFDRRDGYIDNLTDGDSYNDRNRWLMRGQALWKPSDDFSLRLIADYVRKSEQCCAAPFSKNGPASALIAALGGTVFDPVSEDKVAFDSPVQSGSQESGLEALADWNLGWAKASVIASYRDGKARNLADGDYTDLNIAYLPLDDTSAINESLEFNLKGSNDRVDWLAGVYFGRERIGFDASTLFGTDAGAYISGLAGGAVPAALYPAGFGQTLRQTRQSGHNESIYTHNIVHLGGGFDLTVGLRYGNEKKDGWGYAASNAPACNIAALPASLKLLCSVPFYRAHYDDDRLTGTASLSRKFGDHTTAYFTYSNGFKAGGINLDPSNAVGTHTTFKPETVDAFELGVKTMLFDGRMMLRGDVFWMDYENVQLNTYDGFSFSISNEASARSKGLELETDWLLTDELTLRGGITWNHAVYGDDTASASLRGKQITNAPRRSLLLALDYQHPLDRWSSTLFANVAARYQSEVNTGANLDPAKRQGGYALLNARVGLRFSDDLDVSLWANNLTDRFYRVVVFDSVAQTGSYNGYVGQPRTFGIELRKRFF